MSTQSLKYDGSSFLIDITSTVNYTINIAKKRWRFAYTAIYSRRVMLALAKEVISKRNTNTNHYSKLFQTQSSNCSSTLDIIESLIPQHGTNHCSLVPDVDKARITSMVKDKNLSTFTEFGGVEGVANILGTVPAKGITGSHDVAKRIEVFGSNTYQRPPPKFFLSFVVEAFNDTTILILLVCAGLSLGFGIKEHGPGEGWYEGGSIFVAVFLVVVVTALSNIRQERQFEKLSKISNNIKVEVVRNGRPQQISIFDVVVGDVASLKIGDQIPADGLFLSGHSLLVDESSMTGESDHVEIEPSRSPFLLSGAKVVDGYAQMLVTSVGTNTAWGEMMSSISRDTNERTPLQARLDKLTSSIGKDTSADIKPSKAEAEHSCAKQDKEGSPEETKPVQMDSRRSPEKTNEQFIIGTAESVTDNLSIQVENHALNLHEQDTLEDLADASGTEFEIPAGFDEQVDIDDSNMRTYWL